MGWWATGNNDDMMGDEPADLLIGMFKLYARMARDKPSLQEVVDALTQMLRTDGDEILCDPGALKERDIEVRLGEGAPIVSSPSASNSRLLYGMASSLRRVAKAYEEAGFNRKPRLTELLEAFTAILHHEPERFLRDTESLQVSAFALRCHE